MMLPLTPLAESDARNTITSAISSGAIKDLKVIYEPDRESLLEHLEGYVQDGDTILVKASHFMKFEEVVTKLENM